MKDSILNLSLEGSILALLKLARQAVESGDTSWHVATEHHRTAAKHYRKAVEHMAKAQKKGASQRLIADSIGKSPAWVNRLLRWRTSGYRDETPFGPESKAKRERARVQAAERTNVPKRSRSRKDQDELDAALAQAKVAQAEAARARAEAERATDEAMRAKVEAVRERIRAEKAYVPGATLDGLEDPIDVGIRMRLVKTLGMLGSDQAGERASAALIADKERAKLGMTWDELIVQVRSED